MNYGEASGAVGNELAKPVLSYKDTKIICAAGKKFQEVEWAKDIDICSGSRG